MSSRALTISPGVGAVENAALSLRVELKLVGVQGPEEFERAFQTMTQARADAILIAGMERSSLIQRGSPILR